MASEGNVTVIGRSASFHGEVTGEGDVQIEGVLEGSVRVTGARVTVGADAKVRALLSAQDIVVYGRVEGELRAAGRVELRATATVVGDVFSARLAVEDDAVLRGHVDSFQAPEAGPGAESEAGGAGNDATGSRESHAGAPPMTLRSAGVVAAAPPAGSATELHGSGTPELKNF